VNAVTKSGTNQLHGDVFEFLRNGDFNARDFFGIARDTLKRNQFGGTAGGAVIRNRLFFFGGYQGTIQKSSPPSTIAYVPTGAIVAGDFTAFTSPACNGGRQINLSAAQGFTNNRIAPSRFSPAALNIVTHLPLSADPCGKTTFGLLSNQTENLGVSRLDYQKSDRHALFSRFTVSDLNLPSTYDGKSALTVNATAAHYRVYSLALGDTFLIGSNIVSAFHAGANAWRF